MAREGLAEKVAFEQRLKEMRERERETELFGRLVIKAKETTGVKVLSRREPGVFRGSKETSVAGEKTPSSDRLQSPTMPQNFSLTL